MTKKILLLFFISQLMLSCFAFSLKKNQDSTQDKLKYLNLEYWEKYQDDNLIYNLQKAFDNNIDLKIANLKVKESDKIVKLSLSQELPQITFDGQLGRTFASSDLYRGDNNFQIYSYKLSRFLLPVTASYEIDIWGKNRLRTKGQKQTLKMVQQDERSTYIILASTLAVDYYNLVKTDKLLELHKKLFDLSDKTLNLVSNKEKIGLASIDDVLSAKENKAQIEAGINDLETNKDVLQNQIAYLLSDKLFEDIKRSSYDKINTLDSTPETLNSSIILNRPDVIAARENILKADYEARVAKRDLLPSFTIMGTFGFNGYTSLSKIFGAHTGMADLWLMPNWDIFDGGRKYNIIKLRKLEYEQAQKEYEKAVIASIQEVNDTLAILKKENKNYKLSKYISEITDTKAQLKLNNKNFGLANELDYILYQTAQILAQEKLVSDKINYIISSINLYRASGGADYTQNL